MKIGNTREKMVLKMLDNQSDVNLSGAPIRAALSQDKVNLLLGPFASDFVLSDSAIAEKYSIPMIQGGGASDQIYQSRLQIHFRYFTAGERVFQSTLDLMGQLKPPPKTIALLYADDAFDVSVANGTRKAIGKASMKIAVDQRYSSKASDFNVHVVLIKSQTSMPSSCWP